MINSKIILTTIALALSAYAGAALVDFKEVVVTGVRASLSASSNIKRSSNVVADTISASDIGKFPDKNVTESLQHIPGVSISRLSSNNNSSLISLTAGKNGALVNPGTIVSLTHKDGSNYTSKTEKILLLSPGDKLSNINQLSAELTSGSIIENAVFKASFMTLTPAKTRMKNALVDGFSVKNMPIQSGGHAFEITSNANMTKNDSHLMVINDNGDISGGKGSFSSLGLFPKNNIANLESVKNAHVVIMKLAFNIYSSCLEVDCIRKKITLIKNRSLKTNNTKSDYVKAYLRGLTWLEINLKPTEKFDSGLYLSMQKPLWVFMSKLNDSDAQDQLSTDVVRDVAEQNTKDAAEQAAKDATKQAANTAIEDSMPTSVDVDVNMDMELNIMDY
jgi:hypothetical protein